MGQMTPVQMFLSIGMLIVNGSFISNEGNQTTESLKVTSKGQVEKELSLLCEELEEKKYDQNRTLWKLKMIPFEDILSHKKVMKQWNVGLFSSSLDITYEQLGDLLTKEWIEDKFDKLLQENRKSVPVMPGRILPVNALVVVDKALDNMVANSSQFVREFFPLVNHLLGSVGIEIKIVEILLESSQGNFGFFKPLDEKHGMQNLLHTPPEAFLWEVQKRELNYDVVLMMSGLNICSKTESVNQTFNCNLLGSAGRAVSGWPFYRKCVCTHKPAIIEVRNPNDTVSKWKTAVTTAHEVVHLIGDTQHDGTDGYVGGGPGGQDCRKENQHIMAPARDLTDLYRVCKEFEPWSQCTIDQVKFFSSSWTKFCPGSFFTLYETPFYYGLLILLFAALTIIIVVYCYFSWKKERSIKDSETEEEHQALEQPTQAAALLVEGGLSQELQQEDAAE